MSNVVKFSDIMLDLDTGDASMHDVHVKEAMGKINVAHATYEYATALAECDDANVIQEAAATAEESGLPTDPKEASGLATASTAQELLGFFDVLTENAKKVKSAAERDMKAIIGLGKKYGISTAAASSGNFMISFAKPLAEALVREHAANRKSKNKIRFARDIFPKANDSEKLIFAYGNSMARLGAVFGLSIGDCIEDPTVQEVLSIKDGALKAFFVGVTGDKTAANDPRTGFDKGGIPNVDALYKALLKGSSVPHVGKVGTTGSADAEDIAELIVYTYVAHQVSKGIVTAASAKKKAGAQQFIDQLLGAEETRHDQSGKGAQKKISKKFDKINGNIKEWAAQVSNSSDLVVKTFSDAVSALGKIATGEEGIAAAD